MARLVFAWTGAGLFAGSLAYFLYTYAVTFGEITGGRAAAGDIIFDVALFSAFAGHHSVFARESVRAWISRRVVPGLERSLYVWAASLMLIGVCWLWRPIPGTLWQIRGAGVLACYAVQVAGVWLTLRSASIIDVWELAGVRQASADTARRRDWDFRADGPYGLVRHPIYLGWLLIVFAVPTMTMTRLLFAIVSSVYIVIAIPFEERSLRRASNGAYDAYMHRVRRRLLPGLY